MTPEPDAPVWGLVWNRLQQVFDRCSSEIRTKKPDLRVRTGRWGNQHSPFWAWAAFARSDPTKEDLVLSVTFHDGNGRLRAETELMEEQGPILSKLPEENLDQADPAGIEAAILRYLDKVETFIESQLDTIAELV